MSADYAAALDLLTDAELDSMTSRAYRAAARSWSEYRTAAEPGRLHHDLAAILHAEAHSASEYHATLAAERRRRQEPAP